MSDVETPHSLAAAPRHRNVVTWLAYGIVAALGAWLIWPASGGRFPASADHFVHLTRAWLYSEVLQGANLRDWCETWGFGFPLGELYPVLGDVWINVVHALALGQNPWPASYAFAFAAVFIAQGLIVVHLSGLLGLSRWGRLLAGVVGGGAMVADPGYYREGGWRYIVEYGVWPQTLAIGLCWWSLAQTMKSLQSARGVLHLRSGALAAILAGLALLAHPIAMPTFALAWPLLAWCAGEGSWRNGDDLARKLATIAGVAGAGLLIAAWWYVPMLAHRDYAANYGWQHLPMLSMLNGLLAGRWTQNFPSILGYATAAALVLAAWRGPAFVRFVAAFTLIQWMLAASDTYWALRLDHLSESFTHLQYQRFLTGAKPGLFLLGGYFAGWLFDRGLALRQAQGWPTWRRAAALVAALLSVGLAGATAWQVVQNIEKWHVGELRVQRDPEYPALDQEFADLAAWTAGRSDVNDRPMRVLFQASRNSHWYMDFPVISGGHPIYKTGFTPGDNFVHKPESDDPQVWARAGVDALVVRTGRPRPLPDEHAAFGALRLLLPTAVEHSDQLALWSNTGSELRYVPIAHWNERDNALEASVPAPPANESYYVQLPIAAFARWEVTFNDEPVRWFETPIIEPHKWENPENQPLIREGKAMGPNGSEPSLITIKIDRAGTLRATYQRAQGLERGLVWLGAAVLVVLGAVMVAPRMVDVHLSPAIERGLQWLPRRRLVRVILALVAALLASAAWRTWQGARHEADHLFAQVDRASSPTTSFRASAFKTNMVLRPAAVVRPRAGRPAKLEVHDVRLAPALIGWAAVEDDDSQREELGGEHRLVVSVRQHGQEAAAWQPLLDLPLPHTPNRRHLDLNARDWSDKSVDLRLEVSTDAQRGPRIGVDLVGVTKGAD